MIGTWKSLNFYLQRGGDVIAPWPNHNLGTNIVVVVVEKLGLAWKTTCIVLIILSFQSILDY